MKTYRLKPDLDDDDITEAIYRVSLLNEPLLSVALDMGVTVEMLIPWINAYEQPEAA